MIKSMAQADWIMISILMTRTEMGTESGNAPPAMNDPLSGTTTDNKYVILKASASMRANSDSVSNEIDESDLQYEKHDEQRI
jgi:hypothetical protein